MEEQETDVDKSSQGGVVQFLIIRFLLAILHSPNCYSPQYHHSPSHQPPTNTLSFPKPFRTWLIEKKKLIPEKQRKGRLQSASSIYQLIARSTGNFGNAVSGVVERRVLHSLEMHGS